MTSQLTTVSSSVPSPSSRAGRTASDAERIATAIDAEVVLPGGAAFLRPAKLTL